MGKQYGKEILPIVLELEQQGYTHRMVAEELGYTREQIKGLVKQYHRRQRKLPAVCCQRSRPRKQPLSAEEEYKKRIGQLEMENELLRSFLQDGGRRRKQS